MSDASQVSAQLEIDELEIAACSPTPTLEGARWITLQCVQHLWEATAQRDPRTLDPLPRLLSEVLAALPATSTHPRPLPADVLDIAADVLARPLARILAQPTTKVVRDHVMQPVYALREVDARTMAWLGQRPGRTAREKLSGEPHALGVVRPMRVDTWENQVVRRVLKTLRSLLEPRLEHAGSFGPSPSRILALEELERLCTTRLRASALTEVPPATAGGANNVLLDHPDYNKVWRTWQLLRQREELLAEQLEEVQSLVLEAVRWVVTQHLTTLDGAISFERVVRTSGVTETGISFSDQVQSEASPVLLLGGATSNGRVRLLNGNKFGFIEGEGSKDWYFNRQHLGPGVSMSVLSVGTAVHFEPSKDPQGRQQARKVTPATAEAWLCRTEIRGDKIELSIDGLSGAPDARSSKLMVKLVFDQAAPLEPGRGLPIAARPVQGVKGSWTGFADAQGFCELSRWLLGQRGWRPTAPQENESGLQLEEPVELLGLDSLDGTFLFHDGAGLRQAGTPARVSRVALKISGHEWLTTAPGALWPISPTTIEHWSLERLLHAPPSAEGERAIGVDRIVCRLAEHLPRSHHGVAWTVPDDLQELEQRDLRTTMALRFGRTLPVWRSIAAAMAWQLRDQPELREGQNLVVLDAEGWRLTVVFLVARHDEHLARRRPLSGGMYWERRPALPLGEHAAKLSSRAFLKAYAQALAKRAVATSKQAKHRWAVLADYLLDSGIAERLLDADQKLFVELEGEWFELSHDAKALQAAAAAWTKALDEATDEWSREGPFKELLAHPPGKGDVRILLTGRIFTTWGDKDKLAPLLRRFLHKRDIDAIEPSTGQLALGAREAMDRVRHGLVAWRDWLPDLYLEVMKDGLFDELVLVEGRQVDASMGEQTLIEVEQPLLLPAGQPAYGFPLESDRQNRRPAGCEIRLESNAFPLEQDIEVTLSLRYRYGLADAWELEVTPRYEPAPFKSLRAAWVESRGRTSGEGPGPIPPFATRAADASWRKGGAAIVEQSLWFRRVSRRLDLDNTEHSEFLIKQMKRLRWALYAVHSDEAWAFLRQNAMVEEYVEALCELAGMARGDGSWELEMRFREHRMIREEAQILLACAGKFAPEGFSSFLSNRLNRSLQDPRRFGNQTVAAADATGRVLALDADKRLEDALWRVLDRVRPWHSPRLHLRALSAWARIAWRREQFVATFAAKHPEASLHLLACAERILQNLISMLEETSRTDQRGDGFYLFPFGVCCELSLALLRLRATDHGTGLEAGQPRLDALARTIRRLDGMLTRRRIPFESKRLKLQVDKPATHRRISDLAWLLSSMLTGTEHLARVHIEATDDD